MPVPGHVEDYPITQLAGIVNIDSISLFGLSHKVLLCAWLPVLYENEKASNSVPFLLFNFNGKKLSTVGSQRMNVLYDMS